MKNQNWLFKVGDIFFNETKELYYQIDSIDSLGSTYVYNCVCGFKYDRKNDCITDITSRRWIREEAAHNMVKVN